MEDNDNKKERILRATLKLITENGFHGTPVSLIANEAEVGAGTIYRYFANKEAIINELYDRIQQELHSATMADIPPEVSVRDEFYLKWRHILSYFLDHPLEAKFLEQYAASTLIHPSLTEETQRRNAHLKVLIARGLSGKAIRDVDYNAVRVMMWGTVQQLRQLQESGHAAVTEKLIADTFSIFWDGLRRREE
jgi:AcrR family transcriptional regulator